MTYHRIADPRPVPEADIDTPRMLATAAAVESGDEDLRMLARLAAIGMELAEAQADHAKARLAAATGDNAALKTGEDPTGPFNKIAQTVRRIVALKTKTAGELERRRAGLVAERASRRARRAEDHRRAVVEGIDDALTDAFTEMYGDGEAETDEGDALCREMLIDKENLLSDLGEFEDWLDRPIGETVARLCAELGLPADTCVRQGDAWLVKRPPTPYRIFRDHLERRPPSPSGEGQTAKPSGWGSLDEVHPPAESATLPHPGRSASRPSP
jgi:hypothetical protein